MHDRHSMREERTGDTTCMRRYHAICEDALHRCGVMIVCSTYVCFLDVYTPQENGSTETVCLVCAPLAVSGNFCSLVTEYPRAKLVHLLEVIQHFFPEEVAAAYDEVRKARSEGRAVH